jgi:RHS repeat-associated protein
VAGAGPGFFGDGGLATGAYFGHPSGIAVDAAGNLFLADAGNNRVRRVDTTGTITTFAGTGANGISGTGGPAAAAPLTQPVDVAIDPAGDVLIGANGIVRRVRPGLGKDSFSNASESVVPDASGEEAYVFDNSGRHTRTRHAATGADLLSFANDPSGGLLEIRDGNGNLTTIERDPSGNPTAIVSPFGQRTTLSLDANGYLASVTNPAGETVHMTYTADGLLTRMEDARGNASTMSYDADGRLLSDVDAASGSQTFSKTGSAASYEVSRTTGLGRLTNHLIETLPVGDRRQTDTDPDGTQTVRLIKQDGSRQTTLANGVVDTLVEGPDPRFSMLAPVASTAGVQTPGGLNRQTTESRTVLTSPANVLALVSKTDVRTINGRSFTTTYDGPTRTVTNTSATGRQTTLIIDTLGRTTRRTVAGLLPVDFAYDSRGRLATTQQGIGADQRISTYAYNPDGYLQTLTDPLGRAVGFSYDAAGRATTQTLPDTREIQLGYDANGNPTLVTPPGQPAHVFEYTPVNLLSRYVPPDVGAGTNATEYAYNADRQLTSISRPDGRTVQFTYDAAGRLGTTTIQRGTYTYAYHPVTGQLTSITAPDGGTISYAYDGDLLLSTTWSGAVNGTVSRTYDDDFRVESISVNGAGPITYTYDADGLVIGAGALSITRNPQSGLVTGTTVGNVTDSMIYNQFGELIEYVARYAGADIYRYQLTRDQLGRITQKVETIEGATDTYDYEYDLAGRLNQVARNGSVVSAYSYDSNGNRLAGPGASTLATYDDQDRLLQYGSATYTYTAAGELVTRTDAGQTATYTYDELGNLLTVSGPSANVDYLIDAANRRTGKKLNGSLTQAFLWQDDLRPAAELDAAGAVVSRFVYAEHVNVPEYMVKGDATYRFITDHLGTPRIVVDASTGTIVQTLAVNEFGEVQADSHPRFQPFGFAGGFFDPEVGLTRFGSRDYDAEVGRWTSKDLIMFAGGDTNLYAYVGNDPISRSDQLGMSDTKRKEKERNRKEKERGDLFIDPRTPLPDNRIRGETIKDFVCPKPKQRTSDFNWDLYLEGGFDSGLTGGGVELSWSF